MSDIPDRRQQHPSWCTGHTRAFLGPLGECNGDAREALHDEHGPGLAASAHWWDGDDEPWGALNYLAHPAGEHWAHLSLTAIDTLIALLETHPDELAAMLRHLATTLRTDVPA